MRTYHVSMGNKEVNKTHLTCKKFILNFVILKFKHYVSDLWIPMKWSNLIYSCTFVLSIIQIGIYWQREAVFFFAGPFAIYDFDHRTHIGLKSLLKKDPLLFLVLGLALLSDTKDIKDMLAFPRIHAVDCDTVRGYRKLPSMLQDLSQHCGQKHGSEYMPNNKSYNKVSYQVPWEHNW